MAQFLRPISDITTTQIVGSYTAIDEVTFNDADYLTSNDNSTATYECGLSSATDPVANTGHIVRVRWAKADTNVAPSTDGNTQSGTAYLYQGATLIATLGTNANLGNFVTLVHTLSAAEADSITNYADLRIRVDFPASGAGPGGNRRGGAISWAEMEIPVPNNPIVGISNGAATVTGIILDKIHNALRVPTETELNDERLSWGTNDEVGAFGSPLKLPMAGYRHFSIGSLGNVGTLGLYWSSSTLSRSLYFESSGAGMDTYFRADGFSVRLILFGTFTQQNFDDNYLGKTIIVDGLTYGFVYNTTTSKIWLDRNLGATQVATSSTDEDAYGWLYQWGRLTDGHQIRTSGTTTTLSSSDEPGHDDFILSSAAPNDWRDPQNDNLLKYFLSAKSSIVNTTTITGDLTAEVSLLLIGELNSVSFTEAMLTGKGSLNGNINGLTIITSVLISQNVQIETIVNGIATVNSVLIGKGSLNGNINGLTIITSVLISQNVQIETIVNGIATINAILTAKGILQAVINANAFVDGTASARVNIIGETNGIATTNSVLNGNASLSGEINSAVVFIGALLAKGQLVGTSNGVSIIILVNNFLNSTVNSTTTTTATLSGKATLLGVVNPLMLNNLELFLPLNETSGTDAFDAHKDYDGVSTNVTVNQAGKVDKAYSFNNSSSRVDITTNANNLSNSNAISFGLWFKSNSNSSQCLFTLSRTDSPNNYISIFTNPTTGGHDDESLSLFFAKNGVNIFWIFVKNGENFYNDDVWHRLWIVIDGVDNRIYVDGKKQLNFAIDNGTATTPWDSPFAAHLLTLGRWRFNTTDSNYFGGLIEQFIIYKGSVSDALVTKDYNSNNGQPYSVYLGTHTTGLLTENVSSYGVINSLTTITGILNGSGALNGVIGFGVTTTGALVAIISANGTVNGFATLSGTLTAQLAVNGNINGVAIINGSLSAKGFLNGVSNGQTTTSGSLSSNAILEGTANATANLNGILTAIGSLTGTSNASSTTTGTLSSEASLNAFITSTTIVTGTLTANGILTGTVNGTSVVFGLLNSNLQGEVIVDGSTNTVGTLTGTGNLNGVINSATNLSGEIIINTIFGTSNGTATTQGELSVIVSIEGIINGESTTSGILTAKGLLSGISNGSALVNASIIGIGALQGVINSSTQTTLINFPNNKLLGIINGVAFVSGSLTNLLLFPINRSCFYLLKYKTETFYFVKYVKLKIDVLYLYQKTKMQVIYYCKNKFKIKGNE